MQLELILIPPLARQLVHYITNTDAGCVHHYQQVENASNMIVAAKNVMNAVVLIVKSCYIASVAVS